MPKPLSPAPQPPVLDGRVPHELDLEAMTAGTYCTIGRCAYMVVRMNLTAARESPVRDLDEIDLRLVHAWWECCDD